MKKKIVLMTACMFFAFLSTASCEEPGKKPQPYDIKQQSIERPAPDFTLKDLSGTAHLLSEYRGKTVLLNFTTTWCPYCKKDIPNLKKMYDTYKDQGFELIAIYIQESDKKVASFAEHYELPYTVLLDPDGSVAQTYGVRGVPTKVLIDKNGTILCWACRTLDVMLQKEFGKGD